MDGPDAVPGVREDFCKKCLTVLGPVWDCLPVARETATETKDEDMSKIETLHRDFLTIERLIQRANEAAWGGNGSQRKAAIAWKKQLTARRAAIVCAAGIEA